MKVFIIPDIHLKPIILEKASEIINKGNFDRIIMLGDLVDDWDQEMNIGLYNRTFDAVIDFVHRHPNTYFCYGNHDVSYPWDKLESGYSTYARQTVIDRLEEFTHILPAENYAYVHYVDGVLFSHAGIMTSFVIENFGQYGRLAAEELTQMINELDKDKLWRDNSPLWARPEYGGHSYPFGTLQVVGHTPVKEITAYDDIVIVDTFSTYSNGRPIGDETFAWVDTEKKEVHSIQI